MSARLSIAAVCTYQALLAALIFLKPEVDPLQQPISEYALGRLARQDRLPAAVRRALLWSAGVPLVGLVVFFVILARSFLPKVGHFAYCSSRTWCG